jgi:polyphenol oxidase
MMQPDWPVPPHVRSVFSTRAGGVSVGSYSSLNLGLHVGDVANSVRANRQLLADRLGVRPIFMEQVHGTVIATVDTHTPDGVEADGAFTLQKGLACTMMVADCLPLLITNTAGSCVAAVHAGWRGLAAGVIEAALQKFPRPEQLLVWLGPCIGPQAFEVDHEVRDVFVGLNPLAAQYFVPQQDKWLANLSALARQRLHQQGVTAIYGNDGSPPWCTFINPSLFFSHRRDRISGRMAACIWLD